MLPSKNIKSNQHPTCTNSNYLVIICTSLGASGNAREAPPIQLSSKARELGVLEIKRHHLGSELSLLQDDESLPMWKPGDDVGNLSIGKNLHQLHANFKSERWKRQTNVVSVCDMAMVATSGQRSHEMMSCPGTG